jgi:hypothetical protein
VKIYTIHYKETGNLWTEKTYRSLRGMKQSLEHYLQKELARSEGLVEPGADGAWWNLPHDDPVRREISQARYDYWQKIRRLWEEHKHRPIEELLPEELEIRETVVGNG